VYWYDLSLSSIVNLECSNFYIFINDSSMTTLVSMQFNVLEVVIFYIGLIEHFLV